MIVATKHFGELEISESEILTFEEGVPGFEHTKKYVLVKGQGDSPFLWLQSIEESKLAFALVDPFSVKKDYDIEIDEETVGMLGIESIEDVLVYAIVVVPEDTSKMSMNLKAPVIINKKNGKSVQKILDNDRYSVRHYIIEELQRQEVTEHACSCKEEGSVNCNR